MQFKIVFLAFALLFLVSVNAKQVSGHYLVVRKNHSA